MRIVSLSAENFKRLRAVEISPSGDVITIGGKNGAGKSSVLDAIWVGLAGRAKAPPQPVRKGEEKCTIKLDLGELIITRTFTAKEGGLFTDTIKVADPEGRSYPKPQTVLDELMGSLGFDPFAFVQMKPEDQAETLLGMVALSVDLDDLAEADATDFAARRDINRDALGLKARIEAIVLPEKLPGGEDRADLVAQLGKAADTNTGIQAMAAERRDKVQRFGQLNGDAERLEAQISELQSRLETVRTEATTLGDEIAAFEELPPLVDTDDLRKRIGEAEHAASILAKAEERRGLVAEFEKLKGESDALTAAMAERETQRQTALGKAKMPIAGLGFSNEGGKPRVTFNGVPFEQASSAEQLRASTAIAMAANPDLRVLRIKDGSLLDDDSMAMLAEMAKAEDFQLWVERVGTGGVGIILEDGAIVGAEAKAEPEPEPKAKAKKGGDAKPGPLL